MNYGIKMKELREKENVTQQSIADYMGISRTSYKQFENQYDIIPIKRLNQFCNFFDISIKSLDFYSFCKNYQFYIIRQNSVISIFTNFLLLIFPPYTPHLPYMETSLLLFLGLT